MAPQARPLRSLRVVAVDDHAREEGFLRTMFDATPDLNLAGFFTSHETLLTSWTELQPEIVLVDVRWRAPDGAFVAEHRRWPQFKEVADKGALTFALSVSQEAQDIVNAGRNGAVGYLRKYDSTRTIARIRSVIAGRQPDPTFAEAMAYLNEINDLANRLTPREFEVIQLIAEGLHPPEIARDWGIDAKTVNGHVASIRNKLGLYGYGAIGAWATRHGIV